MTYGLITGCLAAESVVRVEQKARIGDWGVVCTANVSRLRMQDCSLVTGAHAEHDQTKWVKISIMFSTPLGDDAILKVRTPNVHHLKRGVILSLDGRQAASAPFDECFESYCQATANVGPMLLEKMVDAKQATFEYSTSDTTSIALPVSLNRLSRALTELAQWVGIRRPASAVSIVRLEMRNGLSGPIISCRGTAPPQFEVSQNVITREDTRKITEWANDTKWCASAGFVIANVRLEDIGETDRAAVPWIERRHGISVIRALKGTIPRERVVIRTSSGEAFYRQLESE
jgi:invasion protein IalB